MITVFGHICKDVVDESFVPGSGVLYGGLTLTSLHQHFKIVTKVWFCFLLTFSLYLKFFLRSFKCNSDDLTLFAKLKDNKYVDSFQVLDKNCRTTTFKVFSKI